ncbi:hypothetical protein U1Q18_004196 [Sarracenia purpurea var. burkii]
MADGDDLDLSFPPCLRLVSAFLAVERPHLLISLARDCGGGSITERVQSFIWEYCIRRADEKTHPPFLKSFLKKLIVEVESQGFEVLDKLYERLAFYMTSLKDDDYAKSNSRVLKFISFLFPEDCHELPSCPKSRKLVVPLQCSLNMLEGVLFGLQVFSCQSSSFLAQKYSPINPVLRQVGSGVGLVGICLAHVKASKVILSDGDLSTLENMKHNLELNGLGNRTDLSERTIEDPDLVKCIHLPWESSVGIELQDFMPDIILGADVIYDPLCLPHLVQVLAFLLKRGKEISTDRPNVEYGRGESREGPIAFIASVIRNIDTFNHFLRLAGEANLNVEDVTEDFVPFNLLPYLQSYTRSSTHLFTLTCL